MKANTSSFREILESVVLVLGVILLAGVVKPVLDEQASMERDTQRADSLRSVSVALENYFDVYGVYPTTDNVWSGISADGQHVDYVPGLVPEFLPALPQDPNTNFPVENAGFLYCSNGLDYKLMAHRTPESMPVANPFADPVRPDVAWMVSSAGARNW